MNRTRRCSDCLYINVFIKSAGNVRFLSFVVGFFIFTGTVREQLDPTKTGRFIETKMLNGSPITLNGSPITGDDFLNCIQQLSQEDLVKLRNHFDCVERAKKGVI